MRRDPVWNHNLQYQRVLLRAMPDRCRTALDIGCGQGFLLAPLAGRADEVVGIDQDAASLAAAADRVAELANVRLVEGDAMTHAFGQRFDAVLSVAVLHHLPLDAGLERMKRLTARGGLLGVVGLARSRSARDYARDGLGAVETASAGGDDRRPWCRPPCATRPRPTPRCGRRRCACSRGRASAGTTCSATPSPGPGPAERR